MKARVLVSFAALGLVLPACVVVNSPPKAQPAPAATTAAPPPATTAAPPATTAATPPPAATTPPQPEFREPPAPPPIVEQPHGIGEGRPASLKEGAVEGYWVWHDGGGWHLRTSTHRVLHRFSGRASGLRGQVGNIRAVKHELGDRFRVVGNQMLFDFHTAGHEDGFDFQVAEGDCVQFYLLIDGKAAETDHVWIGAGDHHPNNASFRVCR